MLRRRKSDLRVLKAASSAIRLQILNILLDEGPQSYTELMKVLKLNPSRDAGKFAYHLKYLLKANLVDPDVETKEYYLTDLGRTIISFTEEVQQRFFKKKMYVRTSRWAMEEFDRNKIAESLVKEANVPVDVAQKIAKETENRILEFKTKYLTAPLIREIVNAILIEKGLEDYRHKLSRLGLPIFDVTQLIRSKGAVSQSVDAVHDAAGDAVIEEYTLMNTLPRDIADAHVSGTIHLNNLGTWVLKPTEILHDLRFFLKNGLTFGRTTAGETPPKSLEAALLLASNVLKIGTKEVTGEQVFDFFNIFLAPYTLNLPEERVRDNLRLFVDSVNPYFSRVRTSLGLELVVPDFLEEREATGPGGKKLGCYSDFVEESRRLASLMLEVIYEKETHNPFFNPSLIVKIRSEVLRNQECWALLFQCHKLAAETGLPYFANMGLKGQSRAAYTASGCRFASDWKGDWELDTMRTGNIDSVVLNLPRMAYEAKGRQTTFFKNLDAQLEMALRALQIKYRTIKQRAQENLLPLLTLEAEGDHYFRIENASRLINFIGLSETVESFMGESLYHNAETKDFAEKIVKYLSQNIKRSAKKPETRVSLARLPNAEVAKRLAVLDTEKYGWRTVRVQGDKEQPVYSDVTTPPIGADLPWRDRLRVEERFHKLTPGGHVTFIQLPDFEQDPTDLVSTTREIVENYTIGLYVYNRNLSYCANCHKLFNGFLAKCPLCGSVNKLTCINRASPERRASSS